MNILWISHFVPYPPKGGNLQRSYNLLKEVAKKNRVYLIAFNQKAVLPTAKDVQEAIKELKRFCDTVEILEIPSDASKFSWYYLVSCSFFSKYPYTVNWTKSYDMHSKIKRLAQRFHFDLAHFDTIGLAEYIRDIGSISKVLNHHNIESDMMLRRAFNERNLLKKTYFLLEASKLKKYEKRFCPKFDYNIAVSELDKKVLKKTVGNINIAVVPNGVDTNYFQPYRKNIKNNTLIFCGRLNAYPNEKGLIYFCKKVWPLLKQTIPQLQLRIIGRNPPKRIKKLASSQIGIEVVGYVDDIRPYVAEAEVYVCPIWDGGGTKLKILDALAMGKAVVATTIACEGIDVIPGKNVLIADTPIEFLEHIEILLQNSELKDKLGYHGRQLVEERYSWLIVGKKLNEVYSEVIKCHHIS